MQEKIGEYCDSHLQTSRERKIQMGEGGVFFNILIEFSISVNPVRPIQVCLIQIYSAASIGKCISYLQWYESRRCFIAIAFQICFRIKPYEDSRKPRGVRIK
jgi:hypothetical protein